MQKKLLTAVVAMSVMMAGALPAFADDHEPVRVYDKEQHILMFAVDGECMLDAEMDIAFTVGEDGAISFEVVVDEEEVVAEETVEPVVVDEDATDPLEGCYPFSVEGPNGQVNHGTFVSNLMHALKEMGIKGSDKKEFKSALKEYGKGDMQVKVKDVDDESSLTVTPAKAEKTNKGQAKKAEKANKGQNK
ncbi:MAG: hypothetical protein OEY55_05390 [Acidimicrobiia bacterium]|nr:hypothetical protein [Acidimicrobiia bacterium]MDH5421216.1 hypothetical protein [Acidimicrobiia bacterium]MDH5502683.1 hypothetical protein [Acidimicrobiia bacterium]